MHDRLVVTTKAEMAWTKEQQLMACLLKRGGVWTARIYTDGKEVWRSLGTGDRQVAERKADRCYRYSLAKLP